MGMTKVKARLQPMAATVRGLSDEQIKMIHRWVADLRKTLSTCATIAEPVLLGDPEEAVGEVADRWMEMTGPDARPESEDLLAVCGDHEGPMRTLAAMLGI